MTVAAWWGTEHVRLCAVRALYVHVPLIAASAEWASNPFTPPLPANVTSVDANGRPLNGGYYQYAAEPGDTPRPMPFVEVDTLGDPFEADTTDAEGSLWQVEIVARARIGVEGNASSSLARAKDQAVTLASVCHIALAQYTIDVARTLDPGGSFGICWATTGQLPELRNSSLMPVEQGQQITAVDATCSVVYFQRRYNPAGWRGNPVVPAP